MRAFLLLAALPPTIAAQQPPTRTFAKPDVEYAEPFSQILSLRELRDGRVVVSDPRDKTVQVVDLRAGNATKVGREGSGPLEWGAPGRLLAYLADSTIMPDGQNSRLLVIAPDGKPVRTMSPAAPSSGPGQSASSSGGGAVTTFGGNAGNLMGQMSSRMVIGSRAVDARARFYYQGSGLSIVNGVISSPDTLPVFRSAFGAAAVDTVAWLRTVNTTSGNSSGGAVSMSRVVPPFQAGDEWVAFPDGRIAIARARDYHVDVIQPDGGRVSGPPVAYTPVRITDAEKEEWRRNLRNTSASTRVTSIGGGAPAQTNLPANLPEPSTWPETKSAFVLGQVWAAPNGDVWIFRARAAGDPIPVADVFDAQGKIAGRVVLPRNTRLVGFGAKSVYLARLDDDDLQYLQRHPVLWSACPPTMAESCAR